MAASGIDHQLYATPERTLDGGGGVELLSPTLPKPPAACWQPADARLQYRDAAATATSHDRRPGRIRPSTTCCGSATQAARVYAQGGRRSNLTAAPGAGRPALRRRRGCVQRPRRRRFLLEGEWATTTFPLARGEANGATVLDIAGNGAAAGDSLVFEGYGARPRGELHPARRPRHWANNSADAWCTTPSPRQRRHLPRQRLSVRLKRARPGRRDRQVTESSQQGRCKLPSRAVMPGQSAKKRVHRVARRRYQPNGIPSD
jgi:hypothetical protein